MSDTLKEDMEQVCEKYKVNESDLIRRSIVEFVSRVNENPDGNKYLFV